METLRDLRNQRKLTLLQVSKELNVCVRAVSRYEQGTRQKLYQLRWLEKKGKKLAKEQEVKVD